MFSFYCAGVNNKQTGDFPLFAFMFETFLLNYCADSTSQTAGGLTGRGIAAAFRWVRGSGSGDFDDDGRHAPAPCCLQANVERVNERPGIWRPLRKKKNMIRSVLLVSALSS
jgi:hypothetical protein